MSTLNVDIIQSQTPASPVTINDDLIVNGNNNIRPYKVYSALLTQSGTSAPTAVVMENTIGPITFSYVMTGMYHINSSNLFTVNKTIITGNNVNAANGETAAFDSGGPSFCSILTRNGAVTANDCLNATFVEIRVYN